MHQYNVAEILWKPIGRVKLKQLNQAPQKEFLALSQIRKDRPPRLSLDKVRITLWSMVGDTIHVSVYGT